MNKKMNTKTDKGIIIMRMRDFMNGISNAYINDKTTSLKNDMVKPNKKTTHQFIKTLESIKALHNELCTTYTNFDATKGIDAKLQNDMTTMLNKLQKMHMTKADKVAMIKAQHKAMMDKLNNDMKQQIDNL